jgi:hypothetical protein
MNAPGEGLNSLQAASQYSSACTPLTSTDTIWFGYLLQGLSLFRVSFEDFVMWSTKWLYHTENHLAKIVICILDIGSRKEKQNLFLYSLLPAGNYL